MTDLRWCIGAGLLFCVGCFDGRDALGLPCEQEFQVALFRFDGAEFISRGTPVAAQGDVLGLPNLTHATDAKKAHQAVATIHQVAGPDSGRVFGGLHTLPGQGVVVGTGGH